jgi:hypothetical protein
MIVVEARDDETRGLWLAWCCFWYAAFRLPLVLLVGLFERVIQTRRASASAFPQLWNFAAFIFRLGPSATGCGSSQLLLILFRLPLPLAHVEH